MTVGEGGIRVPLIISGPGVEGGGRQIDAFAYVWDLMPTLLDIADVEYPTEFQGSQIEVPRGRSIRGLLDGSADQLLNLSAIDGH